MFKIGPLQEIPSNCSEQVFSVSSSGEPAKVGVIVAWVMETTSTPTTETAVLLEKLAVRLSTTADDFIEVSKEEGKLLCQCLKAIPLPAWVKAVVNENLLTEDIPPKEELDGKQ